MLLRALYIAAHLAFVHGAPGALPVATVVQSAAHGVDPAHMAGYLVSGHPGARYSGNCGDHGKTCGPFRLHELWAMEFGYELADRDDHWRSAAMASRLHLYAQEKHQRRCTRNGRVEVAHTWQHHLKARHGNRDNARAAWKMRYQKRNEAAMCPEPWCTVLRFAP